MESSKTFRVCVTGAAGRIAYSIYDRLCAGFVFGPSVNIELVLFDIPQCEGILKGLVLEIQDCGYDLLKSVDTATDPNDAFEGIDIGIFLGGFPRKPGMTRKDLLKVNAGIFKG
jgi:malate/lactate dehydrogenase